MLDMTPFKKRVPPTAMLGNQVAFAYVNGIAILVSKVDKWTDKMVIDLLDEQARLVENRSSAASINHFFGEVFGANHRKLIVEWMAQKKLPSARRTALVTDSAIMRAAMTAFSWLTRTETKSFELAKQDAMCEWVTQDTGINAAEVKTALAACYRLIGK